MIIPLWLALPACSAAVAFGLTLAVVLMLSSGRIEWPPRDSDDTPSVEIAASAASKAAARARLQRAAQDRRFEAARTVLEGGRAADAFVALAELADEGHCESARLALQLIQAGPTVYLTTFTAGPKQIARWRALPACWPKGTGH